MAEYIIRLEEGVKLSDICDIEDDGCVWINHHYANGLGETTPDTMAIELPEHGRLIDADALMEQTENWYCSKENCGDNYNGIRCRACWVDDAIGIIDDAPTVLESST